MDHAIKLLREREERKRYFDSYIEYVKKIKQIAESLLGDVEVYVFGSVVEGGYHPVLSDIDVAVITEDRDRKKHLELKVRVQREVGDVFEIHVVNAKEWAFYRRFIGKVVRI